MTATNETLSMATEAQLKRDLPQSIVIPPIRGEMVHLRPATVEDLPRLDELDAFYGASKITGKDAVTVAVGCDKGVTSVTYPKGVGTNDEKMRC